MFVVCCPLCVVVGCALFVVCCWWLLVDCRRVVPFAGGVAAVAGWSRCG